MLRGNLLLAGIAIVEGWYLTSVLDFTPLRTFCAVAGTLTGLMALFLLVTAWLRSRRVTRPADQGPARRAVNRDV